MEAGEDGLAVRLFVQVRNLRYGNSVLRVGWRICTRIEEAAWRGPLCGADQGKTRRWT